MAHLPANLVSRLLTQRQAHTFPAQVRPMARAFGDQVIGTLFPHFGPPLVSSAQGVEEELTQIAEALSRLLRAISALQREPFDEQLPARFLELLFEVHEALREDADAIFYGDPAARSLDEVILTYPGFFAIAGFRVANALHRLKVPLIPRLLTEYAHEKTGVDIHPGATIGRRFCIDHGTGIVIGETCVIGKGVKLYQGVTLGAVTVTKELANQRRHPTLEDNVVIYAGATILGGETVVGHDSIVAGNAWLTQSVPPFSIVSRRSEVRKRESVDDSAFDFVI
jgi:serine O-acetyltransferase